MWQLDKEKYLKIAREQNLGAALTALHQEQRELENETFEGLSGWQPELYEKIKTLRDFSRELWNLQTARGND